MRVVREDRTAEETLNFFIVWVLGLAIDLGDFAEGGGIVVVR